MKAFVFLLAQIIFWSSFHAYSIERIIGGERVGKEEFSFQIAISVGNVFVCGGSIVAPNYVLTAAHCIYKTMTRLQKITTRDEKIHGVTSALIHENYDQIKVQNDIAVLFIQSGISLSKHVKITKLGTSAPLTGSSVVVAGWGVTSTSSNNTSSELLRFSLTIMSTSDCIRTLTGYPIQRDVHICTFGRNNRGVCYGDSGGPLMQNNKQYGVMSWALGCASGYPEVYTSVPYYLLWIKKTTNNAIST